MDEYHRYLGSHFIETLKDGELMVNVPSAFNDPFEMLYRSPDSVSLKDAKKFVKLMEQSPQTYEAAKRKHPEIKNRKDFKKFWKVKKREYAENYIRDFQEISEYDPKKWLRDADEDFRIVCFSKPDEMAPEDEILLWSHYANCHSGIRIRFQLNEDGPAHLIRDIKYRNERVLVEIKNGERDLNLKESMLDLLRTKSVAWKYENESRMFCDPVNCLTRKGSDGVERAFVKFASPTVLGVDCGVCCSEKTIMEVREVLHEKYPKAVLRVAAHHPRNYSLIFNMV